MVSFKIEKESLVMGNTGTNSPSELLFICSTVPIGWGCYTCLRRLFTIYLQRKYQTRGLDLSNRTLPLRTIKFQGILVLIEILSFWIPMMLCQSHWMNPTGVRYVKVQVLIVVVTIMFLGTTHGKILNSKKSTTMQVKDRGDNRVVCNGTTGNVNIANEDLQRLLVDPKQEADATMMMMTIYRSCIMLLTIISILAVDFPIFYPRRHVKTEVSGYSLMDLGAASFVIAAGFMSSRARHKAFLPDNSMINFLTTVFQKVFPVLGMGLLRLVTHKGIQYQEHMSEYGVHWNFFFTISWLRLVPTMITFKSKSPSWITPAIILGLYQMILSLPSLAMQNYVENAPRSCDYTAVDWICQSFFAANREGILGCLSYTGLYLLAEKIAYECIWKSEDESLQGQQHRLQSVRPLLSQSILWTVVWQVFVHVLKIDVSRRTTNLPFCVWTLVVNLWQLTLICYFNIITKIEQDLPSREEIVNSTNGSNNNDNRTYNGTDAASAQEFESNNDNEWIVIPKVLYAFNKNGLIVFVLANLLTGIINLRMDTISVASQGFAFLIVFAYVSVVAMTALAIDRYVSRTALFFTRGKVDASAPKIKVA